MNLKNRIRFFRKSGIILFICIIVITFLMFALCIIYQQTIEKELTFVGYFRLYIPYAFIAVIYACIAVITIIIIYIYVSIYRVELIIKRMFSDFLYTEVITNERPASFANVIEYIFVERKKWIDQNFLMEYLKKEAAMNALQSQINPHFLYNTLESIRGLALLKEVPEVASMIETLASMFRGNMRQEGSLVMLRDEIDCVENYMIIQQFRFRDKFIFIKHIDVDGSEHILSCRVPHLILQPIVENAVFHGLEIVMSGGEIHLYATLTAKRLILRVVDNGAGMTQKRLDEINDMLTGKSDIKSIEEENKNHIGIALTNIDQRIKKQFGEHYGIAISSTLDVGTEVEITLPCLWNDENDEEI